MSFVVLGLVLVTFTYAAPPIVPLEMAACVDGVNNVVQVADISDGQYSIHAQNMVAQTYDAQGRPSCYNGRAHVALPGQLRLVKGQVVVSAANADIKNAEVKMTVKKNSIFIGKVCVDGKPMKSQVPEDVCHHKIYPEIGDEFLRMLSTPGTYDLEEIEKKAHQTNVINLPAVPGALNFIVKGDWQAEIALYVGGTRIAHIKAPSNTPWVNVD
ncbi:hypothetical protein Q1695_010860 [Nippostrongylus brasiliensis]|nr:hypothetical protein Q1695_010860 [Nippostrongylus brasiliensis]